MICERVRPSQGDAWSCESEAVVETPRSWCCQKYGCVQGKLQIEVKPDGERGLEGCYSKVVGVGLHKPLEAHILPQCAPTARPGD